MKIIHTGIGQTRLVKLFITKVDNCESILTNQCIAIGNFQTIVMTCGMMENKG